MEEQQKIKISTTPAGSDTAWVGVGRGIVPAPVTSLSDDGPVATMMAGVAMESATATTHSVEDASVKTLDTSVRRSMSPDTIIIEDFSSIDGPSNVEPVLKSENWIDIVAEEERATQNVVAPSTPNNMEVDNGRGRTYSF